LRKAFFDDIYTRLEQNSGSSVSSGLRDLIRGSDEFQTFFMAESDKNDWELFLDFISGKAIFL